MSDFIVSPTREEPRGPVQGPVQYVRAIRQHLVLVIATVVVALVAAVVFVATAQKQYKATADIAIKPLSSNDATFSGFSLFQQALDGSSSVVTAARVFGSPQIKGPARAAMGADAKGTTITITPLSQSDIVAITASAPGAGQAARAATKFAQSVVANRTALFKSELARHINVIKRQLAAIPQSQRNGNYQYSTLASQLGTLKSYEGFGDPTLQVVAKGTPPAAASWPRPHLTYAVALLAALLLGCGVAVLLEVFNPTVNREEELLLVHRLPILARIPRLRPRVVKRYLRGREPLPPSAWKGYRLLRAVLATGRDGGFPRSILVTSASPADGKTMTAANLAITLAAAELRVVLVDGDLHRPMVAVMFGQAPEGDGLTGVLSEQQSARGALTESTYPGLSLLLAHHETNVRVSLTSERRIKALLQDLRSIADVVVIDSPPLLEVAEALEMAAAVDTVLLCVRLGNTRREKLNQLREMLARRGIIPAGFVVTTRLDTLAHGAYEDAYAGKAPERDRDEGATAREVARVRWGRSPEQ